MTRLWAFFHALVWYGLAFLALNIAWPVLGLFSLPYLLSGAGSVIATERARLVAEHALYGQVPVDFLTSFLAGLGWAAFMTLMVGFVMGSTALQFARQPRRMRIIIPLVLAIWMLGSLILVVHDASGRGLSWTAWVREGCPRPAVNSDQIILTCDQSPRGALDGYEAILNQSRRLLPIFIVLCAVLGLSLTLSSRTSMQMKVKLTEDCQRCGLNGVKCLLCQPRLQLTLPDKEVHATLGQSLELPLTIKPLTKLPMLDVRLRLNLPRGYRLLSNATPQGWITLQDKPLILGYDLVDTEQELRLYLQRTARQWRRRSKASLSFQAETPFSYNQPSVQCLIHSERPANLAERLVEKMNGCLSRFIMRRLERVRSTTGLGSLMQKTWSWLQHNTLPTVRAVRERWQAWWRAYRDR